MKRMVSSMLCLSLFYLCLAPGFSPAVREVVAQQRNVIIEAGQPSVWSLGQAHYLLASMHKKNRGLELNALTPDDLDPNKSRSTRIEALLSYLGIEAQYDQGMGFTNRIATDRVREERQRKEDARLNLPEKIAERQDLVRQIAELNEDIARYEEEDRQSSEARDRQTPPAPPSSADNARKLRIAELKARKANREARKTELDAEITALKSASESAITAPTPQSPQLPQTVDKSPFPESQTYEEFMKKALADVGKPSLHASTALDNFIQMQYEIISKQLTLLRDEAGPEARVIFLELPSSIYTVDKKADDHLAQIEWEVAGYYDTEPCKAVQARVMRDTLLAEGKSVNDVESIINSAYGSEYDDWKSLNQAADACEAAKKNVEDNTRCEQDCDSAEKRGEDKTKCEQDKKWAKAVRRNAEVKLEKIHYETKGRGRTVNSQGYPITPAMLIKGSPAKNICRQENNAGSGGAGAELRSTTYKGGLGVRAIDIIPRQSALNVNEYHATVKQTKFLAGMKWLIGFAGQVDFQRQKQLYEQFVQQEVFASGYGKGTNRFGWTFGPLPGTKRIAPGQRTTYAILAVPRNTLALKLTAHGKAFKKRKSPEESGALVENRQFEYLVPVPGERTESLWVESLDYMPVTRGGMVTTVLKGKYFSPQLGVLVNGKPLKQVVSIARNGGDEPYTPDFDPKIPGEYEITNSRRIIMRFSMGEGYVGTPEITLVSPERTIPINNIKLDINDENGKSLEDLSLSEPMFIDEFRLDDKLGVDREGGKFDVRITGQGLLPYDTVWINDLKFVPRKSAWNHLACVAEKKCVTGVVKEETTKSHTLSLMYPKMTGNVKVRYRHSTRQGFITAEASEEVHPTSYTVRRYLAEGGSGKATVDLRIKSRAQPSGVKISSIEGSLIGGAEGFAQESANTYRVRLEVNGERIGRLLVARDIITLTLLSGTKAVESLDIPLPVIPQVAKVTNPRTGKAEGFGDEEPEVVIKGVNLQHVEQVLFGDQSSPVTSNHHDLLVAKAPKVQVTKGQEKMFPLILQIAPAYGGGKVSTRAYFTFKGEPLPARDRKPSKLSKQEGESAQ
jgi:hypothetical protein